MKSKSGINLTESEKQKLSSRARVSRKWRMLYAVTAVFALAPIVMGFSKPFHDTLYVSLIFLGILNFFSIIFLEISIVKQSTRMVQQAFRDNHIYHGMDTWQFISRNWLRILHATRRKIIYLYVLRLFAFIWWTAYQYVESNGFRRWWKHEDSPVAYLVSIEFDVPTLMVALVILAVFLALEWMLITALPIATSLRKNMRNNPNLNALGERVCVPIGFAILLLGVLLPLVLSLGLQGEVLATLDTFLATLASVLIDNGFWWSAIITGTTHYGRSPFSYTGFVAAQLVGMFLYALWTWVMLRLAKTALDRRIKQGSRKRKPKELT